MIHLGAEGTGGFQPMPLAANAAPIQESVLPSEPKLHVLCVLAALRAASEHRRNTRLAKGGPKPKQ